ncbi:hypothetical protein Nepgr_011318 [Nepenthes gracilis]|uniref:Uncharacterized protein n=1 Tax=Nepenthes gracilis TaxID=150966 RepID=A0AAD3XLV8_NEPGR|nr:hypothetical protein Nepgr_011318 [Nepenthes gracilis]
MLTTFGVGGRAVHEARDAVYSTAEISLTVVLAVLQIKAVQLDVAWVPISKPKARSLGKTINAKSVRSFDQTPEFNNSMQTLSL